MKTIAIVLNRLAGDGKSLTALSDAQKETSYRWVTVDCADADGLPRLDAASTAAIVVFGGDGTLNRCLPVLRECSIPVSIFPAGTVNDLAFQLGLKPDWKQVVSLIAQAQPCPHRLLEANGRPFAIYGAVGFGADMSRLMHRTRRILKPLRSVFPLVVGPALTAAAIVFSYRPKRLRIDTDTGTFEVQTRGLYIANRSHFNRNIDLGWDPESDSAKFRVIIFRPLARLLLCRVLMRMARLRKLEAIRDSVEVVDTSALAIESMDGSPLCMFAEGEQVAEGARLSIRISDRPLLLYRSTP